VERAAALGFDLGLVMESSEVRATPSAAPPQPRRANHPAGRDPLGRLRMPEIWRYEEFSNWMLGLLHPSHALSGDGSLAAQEFAFGLRRARLDRMVSDTQFARWFAQAFAGT